MLKNIAEDITLIFLKNQIIDMKDRDTYIYGFEVVLSSFIVTGTLLMLGVMLREVLLTLVFMVVFVSLRTFVGGYHSDRFRICLVISIALYLGGLALNNLVAESTKPVIGMVLVMAAGIVIFLFSPKEHKNKPLSFEEKQKNKKISRSLTVLIMILTAAGFYAGGKFHDICFIACLTVVSTAVLVIVQLVRGGTEHN